MSPRLPETVKAPSQETITSYIEISIAVWSKLRLTMTASVGQKGKRGGKARVWRFKYMTGEEGDDMMERRKADILDGREAKLGAVEVDSSRSNTV